MTADEVQALRTELIGIGAQRREVRKKIASQAICLARHVGTSTEPFAMQTLVELVTEHDALQAEFSALSKVYFAHRTEVAS